MFEESKAFSSFSVDDLGTARSFYEKTLGLQVSTHPDMPVLDVRLAGGAACASSAMTGSNRTRGALPGATAARQSRGSRTLPETSWP